MRIFFKLFLVMLFVSGLFNSGEAKANACLVASEKGGSEYCDNGSPQTGLPVHSATTTSKAGTKGICNNVNAFSDCKQALEYAKTHEYDYITLGENSNSAVTETDCPTTSSSYASTCYMPKCTYTSDCSSATKTCCKSLINDKCWHECNICKFNRIGADYYPYTDKNLENCELIGENNMSSAMAVYSSTSARNYKVNRLTNIVPIEGGINQNIWTCNEDASLKRDGVLVPTKTKIINDCKAISSKIVNGFNSEKTKSLICVDGSAIDLESYLENYCPLSAVVCNNAKGYYNNAADCEQDDLHHGLCSVTRNHTGYGDEECWHRQEYCSRFGHDSYVTGVYNNMGSTCQEHQNTELRYYCPKDVAVCDAAHAVELHDEKCGACECKSGYNRVDDCNSLFYGIISGYYNAKNYCPEMGYTKTTQISSNCTACPYNAKFWRCN